LTRRQIIDFWKTMSEPLFQLAHLENLVARARREAPSAENQVQIDAQEAEIDTRFHYLKDLVKEVRAAFGTIEWDRMGRVTPMKYFLLVFDRSQQKLIEVEEFADAERAVRARFQRETAELGPDVEVVVLGAANEEALKNTDSRYFGSGREMTPA
jgi:hypothetical protein